MVRPGLRRAGNCALLVKPTVYNVAQVVYLATPLRELRDCGTASKLRIAIVRNEGAEGSSQTTISKGH
jgi:hypothetical protein